VSWLKPNTLKAFSNSLFNNFLLFIFFAIVRNIFNLPEFFIDYINEISIWFIIIAISALGIKTNLQEFSKVSFSYSVILILETLFLLISALVLINVLDI